MASIAELIIKITGQDTSGGAMGTAAKNIKDVDAAADGATKKAGGLKSALGGVGSVAGGIVAGAGLVSLPGLLMSGAQGAAEDEASLIRLNTAIGNAEGSAEGYGSKIDDLVASSQDLAFTDGETTDALALLVNMTGDADTAMADLATAQDLARGANISLEQAAKLLGKTSDENTAALKKLGIELEDGATRTDALAAVQEQFGGQAQQYAESAAGEYAKFNNQLGELQETVGTALIPIFMALAPIILSVVEAAMPAFELLVGVLAQVVAALPSEVILAALVAGMIAWAASTIGVTTAHVALAAATLLAYAPIIALIAAIGLLVAAGYLLVTNFDEIKAAVMGALETIIGFVTDNWPLILALLTGPIGLAVLAIIEYWDEISAAFSSAWEFVSGLLSGSWSTVSSLLMEPVNAAKDAIATAWQEIQDAFDAAWTFVSGWVSNNWDLLLALLTGPIGLAVLAIVTYWDEIVEAFNSAWSTISGWLSGAWATVSGLLTGPVSSAKATIETLLGDVVQFFTDLPGKIVTALGDLTSLLAQKGLDLLTGLMDGISNGWSGLYGVAIWLAGLGGRALAAIGDVAASLWSAGVSLVQGLMGGITSMAEEVAQAAWDVVQGAIDAAWDALVPGSPSRVFFAMGVSAGQGFADGMRAMAGETGTAAEVMVDAAIDAALTRVSAGGGRAAGGGTFAGGGSYRAGSYSGSGKTATTPVAAVGSFAWWATTGKKLLEHDFGPPDFIGADDYGTGGSSGPEPRPPEGPNMKPPLPRPGEGSYSKPPLPGKDILEPGDKPPTVGDMRLAQAILDIARAPYVIELDGAPIAKNVNKSNADQWALQGMNR